MAIDRPWSGALVRLFVPVMLLAACGNPARSDGGVDTALDAVSQESGLDAPADTNTGTCRGDMECADGVFCNGTERCMPGAIGSNGHGCLSVVDSMACLPGQTCDEANQRCVASCAHAPDADGDGHRAADCGGDDCNDADPNRFPGNPEVCDAMNHDEDCDARTFGFRDVDMDSYVDRQCCNTGTAGVMNCGDDCNDSRPNVHPALAEVCDGLDNDCNGMVDETVLRTYFTDGDHDGFGSATAATMMGCVPPAGFAEMSGDCDDARSDVHPGALEQCDLTMADENCDGMPNPATLCFCAGDVTRPCATSGGVCAAGTERCVGGSWGLCSIGPTPEVCNGRDDNCDGSVDEGLFVTCYPDRDNDGYAATGATSVPSCPVPGRDAFAGCPPNQTNRAPLGIDIDCNDTDSTISPGQPELCDSASRDENCDGTVNPVSLCMCLEGSTRPCASSGTCGAGNQSCSGGRWSACSINPVAESCNGVDDNCNGSTDEGLTITCFADADNDGYAANATTSVQSCPVTGRDAVGGCPTNQTNRAPAAGTTDCDDSNAAVSPRAVEQCDSAMLDENCDGTANPSSLCACSGSAMRTCTLSGACAAGTQTCVDGSWGNCSIVPVAEVCNGADDNCDGTVDEGLTVTCYPDGDNDGYAASGATARQSCPISGREAVGGCPTNQTNRSPIAGSPDCNDANAAVNPGAVELCDAAMADENCDGASNPASLCACSGTSTRACALPGACAAGTQTCSSGTWGNCSIVPVVESCNGIDDNCNGTIDELLTVACFADGDNDGYAPTGAATVQSCPVSGRAAVGGCPTNLTNRAPTSGNADCADLNSSVSPGVSEVCDALMADENCDGTANPPALCACSGSGTRACTQPGACAAGTQTCTSGAWSPCTVSPTAEICNGLDDNCNGTVDENGSSGSLAIPCYLDGDSDGYGSGLAVSRCPDATRTGLYGTCPVGYTAIATDCNDANASIHPTATETCNGVDDNCVLGIDEALSLTCYVDGDGDTYGIGGGVSQCRDTSGSRTAWGNCPAGYTNRAGDCLDSNASASPVGVETCNGIDDNCSGATDEGVTTSFYRDADGDGFGTGTAIASCGATAGYVANSTDCNDACSSCHPGGTEVCDGLDNNCNSSIDEGVLVACYADADNDTYAPSGAVAANQCPVGGRATFGGCAVNSTNRAPAAGSIDCADANGARNPGMPEVCNGIDDNCDGAVDEGVLQLWYRDADGDGFGNAGLPSMLPCTANPGYTRVAGDCDDANGARSPGATELCDGIDNNCNGVLDATGEDDDRDGYADTACGAGCTAVTCHDCNDTRADIHPSAVEICDGVDSNCTGSLDGPGEDDDSDTYADVTCAGTLGTDCDDTRADVHPGATELCDRRDNNCSTAGSMGVDTSEDFDVDGHAPTAAACSGGIPRDDCDDHAATTYAGAAEACDGVDNNCVNGIDETALADPQCVVPSTYSGCRSGRCVSIACMPGRADCDATRGCETNVNTDAANCGHCGVSCGVGGACIAGHCDRVVRVASGYSHACALRESGLVVCWGDNTSGALGDGTLTFRPTPVLVAGLTNVAEVVAGRYFTCARRVDGTVMCWGRNVEGQLGDGGTVNRSLPGPVTGLTDATQLTAGLFHVCAIRATGAVVCWGLNGNGQLGDGSSVNRSTPVAVPGVTGTLQVEAGLGSTCARLATSVQCWGSGGFGELGNGGNVGSLVPVTVSGLSDATQIDLAEGTACALRATGEVVCWGRNSEGEIGDGTTVGENVPTAVTGLAGTVAEISTIYRHVCARLATGAVQCWGWNYYGMIGDGTSSPTTPTLVPATALNLSDAIGLTAGGTFTCALRGSGEVTCWGSNISGVIGDGSTTGRSTPGYGPEITYTGIVNVDGSNHSCAVRGTGQALCWGLNDHGQIGDGGAPANRVTPYVLPTITDAVRIVNGVGHTCVLRSGGTVLCWGWNNSGQLGDGTFTNSATPVPVSGLTDAVALTAQLNATCAIRASGQAVCWGSNASYGLGDGTTTNSNVPVAVSGLADAAMIDGGGLHACALRQSGQVTCWGSSAWGQVGGSMTDAPTPRTVVGLPLDVTSVSAGDRHSCVGRADGTGMCWGFNGAYRLGDGTTNDSLTPVGVLGLTGASAIFAGQRHSCALTGNTVRCWGNNNMGQMGDGTTINRSTASLVPSLVDAVGFAAGTNHNLAIRAGGVVANWGLGSSGQLGTGSPVTSYVVTAPLIP